MRLCPTNKLLVANSVWIVIVLLLYFILRDVHLIALYLFPPIVLSWAITNENRLASRGQTLPALVGAAKFHLFVTAPLILLVRLMAALVRARREHVGWTEYFALSFGISLAIAFWYVVYIWTRKRSLVAPTKG